MRRGCEGILRDAQHAESGGFAQRFDDGDGEAPSGRPYDRYEMCWGRHTCHMGVVKALKALAEIPPERRSPAVRRTLDEGAEFMLHHHVHKRSHNLRRMSKPGWKRLGFPLMYQTDVLEILGILATLGRVGDAQGRWTLETTFNGCFLVDIETQGEPSRWITLRALQVMRA